MTRPDPPPELFFWLTWLERMTLATLLRYPEIKKAAELEPRAKAA